MLTLFYFSSLNLVLQVCKLGCALPQGFASHWAAWLWQDAPLTSLLTAKMLQTFDSLTMLSWFHITLYTFFCGFALCDWTHIHIHIYYIYIWSASALPPPPPAASSSSSSSSNCFRYLHSHVWNLYFISSDFPVRHAGARLLAKAIAATAAVPFLSRSGRRLGNKSCETDNVTLWHCDIIKNLPYCNTCYSFGRFCHSLP